MVKDGYVSEYARGDDRELQISLRKVAMLKLLVVQDNIEFCPKFLGLKPKFNTSFYHSSLWFLPYKVQKIRCFFAFNNFNREFL